MNFYLSVKMKTLTIKKELKTLLFHKNFIVPYNNLYFKLLCAKCRWKLLECNEHHINKLSILSLKSEVAPHLVAFLGGMTNCLLGYIILHNKIQCSSFTGAIFTEGIKLKMRFEIVIKIDWYSQRTLGIFGLIFEPNFREYFIFR